MAKKAEKTTKRRTEDIDRNFPKVDDTESGPWTERLDHHYDETRAASGTQWYSKETLPEDKEHPTAAWYGVETLFAGEFEAVLVLGTPQKAKSLSKLMKDQGISAFTLSYEGQGVFRYALPTEGTGAGSFRLIPSDVSKVGPVATGLRQW